SSLVPACEAREPTQYAARHEQNHDHEQEPDSEVPVLRIDARKLVSHQKEDDRVQDGAVEPSRSSQNEHDDYIRRTLEAQHFESHRVGGLRKQRARKPRDRGRSEEHTSELQSRENLVCRRLLEKKKESTREKASRQYA